MALSLGAGWFPAQHKGLAMGLVGAGNVGTAVSVLVAPPLAQWLGWAGRRCMRWRVAILVPRLAMVRGAKRW